MKLSSNKRKAQILKQLSKKEVSVSELALHCGVSEMTIRRDLIDLEVQGKAVRTHGGAISTQRLAYEFSFKEKEVQNVDLKKHIGLVATKLVKPDDIVFIDTGSTSLVVAKSLKRESPRIIITTNLCVASEYVGQQRTRIFMPGGELSVHSPDIYGEWAIEKLSEINVDLAFLGCDGADMNGSFYASDIKNAAISKLMMKRSNRCYLLIDSSKIGIKGISKIGNMQDLSGIVTDKNISKETLSTFRKNDINVIKKI